LTGPTGAAILCGFEASARRVSARHPGALSRCGKPRRESIISASLTAEPAESHDVGAHPGTGTFSCIECGWQLSLQQGDALPECAQCGGISFRRHSIFEPISETEGTLEFAPAVDDAQPAWLDELRESLPTGSRHLAYEDGGEVTVARIGHGWMRVGRSVAADVRLDDPSVSRRHALIVSEPNASLRVLDDRSLNGVFVNGACVEWGKLEDGDRLTIGRYQLFVLDA
jgi:FHA domain/Zinc-ribbon containing domain